LIDTGSTAVMKITGTFSVALTAAMASVPVVA
jgi:hypothetical protein